jgi:hypothetical protein
MSIRWWPRWLERHWPTPDGADGKAAREAAERRLADLDPVEEEVRNVTRPLNRRQRRDNVARLIERTLRRQP